MSSPGTASDTSDEDAPLRWPLLRAIRLLGGHSGLVAFLFLLTLLLVLVSLAVPYIFGQAVAAIEDEDESRIIALGLAVIGAGVVAAMLSALRQLLSGRLAVDVELSLRNRVFEHLLSLDRGFYETKQVGHLVSLIMVTSGPIRTFLAIALPKIASDFLTFLFAGVAMALIDPRLAAFSLWPVPIVVYLVIRMGRVITPAMKARQEASADVAASGEETLRSMLTVEVLGAREPRADHFGEKTDEWYSFARIVGRGSALYDAAIENLPNFAWSGLFLWGGYSVIDGSIPLSTFVTFLGYVGLMLAPISKLGYRLWTTQGASASAQRVFEVLDRDPLVVDVDDAETLAADARTVDLENVSMSFGGLAKALDAVEFDIAAYINVAIVGPTASGKSALLKMITRVHDPEVGEIRVDGQPLSGLTLASLRDVVASVGSSPHIFAMSVFDNIVYGNPAATVEEVERITRELGAHDDIRALPDGYQTKVGEAAFTLPMSLAQIVSIARALARKPGVLLLDDITAPLPPGTERSVVEGMRRLTEDVTIVAVAARPALLALADDIVFLERGVVTARGSFEDLMAESEGFRKLLAEWRLDRNLRRRTPDRRNGDAGDGAADSGEGPST